jgi:uncharacterized protein
MGPKVTQADAQAQYDSGNYREAAALYQQMAKRDRAQRAKWQVFAALAWREEGEYAQMASALQGIKRRNLDRADALMLDVLQAEVALRANDARTALSLLVVDDAQLPDNLRPRFAELRARAFTLNGDFADAARERARLNELLDPVERVANEHEIKELIGKLSPEQRRTLQRTLMRTDPVFKWLNGARSAQDSDSFAESLSSTEGAQKLVETAMIPRARVSKIALVLPRSGPLAPAAKAVMDGIFAGYFHDASDARPEIRIYDSGSTIESADAALQQAVADGAEQILGPMQRDQVTHIFANATVAIPVLALNYADSGVLPPERSLQMALLPEEEAAAAASRMRAKGLATASVLAPDDEFGKRAAGAFEAKFVALGGQIAERSFYPANSTDQASAIRTALGVSESQNRISLIRGIIAMPVTAQATRRYDIDALFLAARPAQARTLIPQLKLYDADDWPMLATSHIYAGSPSARIDADLNGVEFCDAPWIFGIASAEVPSKSQVVNMPSAAGAGGRLFAFGIDAYRISSHLEWLSDNPGDAISGATGTLSADTRGSVRRVPVWSRFVEGVPRLETVR